MIEARVGARIRGKDKASVELDANTISHEALSSQGERIGCSMWVAATGRNGNRPSGITRVIVWCGLATGVWVLCRRARALFVAEPTAAGLAHACRQQRQEREQPEALYEAC